MNGVIFYAEERRRLLWIWMKIRERYCRFYGSDGCRSMGKLASVFYKICSMY